MSAAMDGTLVRGMIKNAAHWFAAVPSLHGAYPVLALLLAWRGRNRWLLAALSFYCASMWIATVLLNQHYIIDLLAGALLAVIAWLFVERRGERSKVAPPLVVSSEDA
jgi:membrane-associated phospholipid phosphatase